jgi:hypothetical protein
MDCVWGKTIGEPALKSDMADINIGGAQVCPLHIIEFLDGKYHDGHTV